MALQWYAAHTKPLAEYAAQSRLQGAGIEVFLPCAKTPKPRPGHWNTPLFPGYFFLRYDMEKGGLRQLRKMPQLVGMVTFQGTVPPVPDQVISDLAERVETLNAFGGVWTRYRTGERVTVSLGPPVWQCCRQPGQCGTRFPRAAVQRSNQVDRRADDPVLDHSRAGGLARCSVH